MILFSLLVSFCLSSSTCQFSILANSEKPERTSFVLDEGEKLCINTTNPYLSVIFHDSILSVRYFSFESIGVLPHELGKFNHPAESGGVSFPGKIGSVEVTALIPGTVTFSYFNFPDSCSWRYVTTYPYDYIEIPELFEPFKQGQLCLWYPEDQFEVKVHAEPAEGDSFQLCSSYHECKTVQYRKMLHANAIDGGFLKIQIATEVFYENLRIELEADEEPVNHFQMKDSIGDAAVAFDVEIDKLKVYKDNHQKNIDADDDDDDNNDAHNHDHNKDEEHHAKGLKDNHRDDEHHKKRRRRSNGGSTFMAIVFLFLIIYAIGGTIVYLYDKKKNSNHRNDHSEDRLLNTNNDYPGNAYPRMAFSAQQPGQPQYFSNMRSDIPQEPAPVQGAFFPTVQQQPGSSTPNGQV